MNATLSLPHRVMPAVPARVVPPHGARTPTPSLRDPFTLSRRLAALLLLASLSVATEAADRKINKNWRSIAIGGYDTVAYFTMGEPVKGEARFEHRWQDARWRFASAEHLKMFADDPERYAPRFGGYCAEGMAIGRTAKIDPEAWLIVDGELYLNYDVAGRDEMARHPEKTIEKAERNWAKLGRLVHDRDAAVDGASERPEESSGEADGFWKTLGRLVGMR